MAARLSLLTLARVVVPERSTVVDAALVVGFALFTALMAQISIRLPFTPVPITGQTFAVILTGVLLGSRLGVASMLFYLALGAIGFPFYAGGSHGVHVLFGATGGYLIGFVFADFVAGFLAERRWDRRFPSSIVPMLAGEAVIFACGIAGLMIVLGVSLPKALELGLYPFVIGDAIKVALAALLLPAGWRLIGRR